MESPPAITAHDAPTRLTKPLNHFTSAMHSCSPLFEIARVLVRLDHVASVIVNANHSIM
jgi:hypothetical protein